ncbi:MAG TPA: septal ring lytic transglycosylase RlpA family protein [Actinomycetota bacterium]
MKTRLTPVVRALVALAVLAGAVVAVRPAGAADLDELRARAQAIADEVTALEHRLADLEDESDHLAASIQQADADIGVLELEIHDTEAALATAEDRFTARAVEAYKSTSAGTELEMLLSARDLGHMLTLAKASANAAESDEDALVDLLRARQEAEAAQDEIDDRKQELLVAQERIDAIGEEVAFALDERHHTLARLTDEIDELERQARIEARRLARQAAAAPHAFADLVGDGGPAPDVPNGFASTGVSFEGIASWYGPGFEGNPTASGQIFDSSLFTAASRDLPLGTWLHVTHAGRGVVVLVNDRGPYIDDRVLDLSRAAAESLGITGLGWVRAEIVVKT